jgi:hypothetical protein
MLAELTHGGNASNGASWQSLAEHAFAFIQAMYNVAGPYFYTGTLGDQVSINTYPIPEDCQVWSYLALLDNKYKQTIDWALANLQSTDTASAPNSSLTGSQQITGMVFDTASFAPILPGCDPHAVWLEGTSHTVAGLLARTIAGRETLPARFKDLTTAIGFLDQIEIAQSELGAGQTVNGVTIPLGQGLVAATSLMDTGFYYTYGPS